MKHISMYKAVFLKRIPGMSLSFHVRNYEDRKYDLHPILEIR